MERRSQNEVLTDEIAMPANAGSISTLTKFITDHARAGFNDEKVHAIGLAAEEARAGRGRSLDPRWRYREALQNIICFACPEGFGEIRVSCTFHDSGSLIINIVDSGVPFNMLLADTFQETQDFFEPGKIPSTKLMKKAIKNIEYRRGTDINTLVFTISPDKVTK